MLLRGKKMNEIIDLTNNKQKKVKKKFSLENAFKKGAATFLITSMAITCVACSNVNPFDKNNSAGQNSSQTSQTQEFEEIPYAVQTKYYSYAEDYPANFFSSKENYFSIGSTGGRFVDLNNYLDAYVFYEKGMDSQIVEEIKRATDYLQSILYTINHGYKIHVQEGEPKKISQYFNKDSIYFCNMTAEYNKQMNGEYKINGLTVKNDLKPPQIYINKTCADDVIVDGKHIKLNATILHEMMHAFGLNHTNNKDDIMYLTSKNYVQDSRGKWMLDNFTSKEYVTDYEKFSDNEIRALIYTFCHSKDLNLNAEMYEIINKIYRYSKYDFQESCDNYLKSNFEKIKNSNMGEKISPNQIICFKSTSSDRRYILNADYIGMYKVIENGKLVKKGRYFLVESTQDDVTLQTIVLAPNFYVEGNTKGIEKFRPERKAIGPYKTYFTSYSNKQYFDDTANWLEENKIKQAERTVYLDKLLGFDFSL